MISRLQPISFGYSMYEVDGVFVGSVGRPVEERVQVIRFIFRPDYGYIRDCYPGEAFVQNDVVKGFLGDTFHNAESYAQKHAIPASYRALLDYLADWKTQVGLFLFGYVVYEICERISKDGIRPEEQIWITYNRDFGVNRIVWSSEHSAAGVAAGGLAPRG